MLHQAPTYRSLDNAAKNISRKTGALYRNGLIMLSEKLNI